MVPGKKFARKLVLFFIVVLLAAASCAVCYAASLNTAKSRYAPSEAIVVNYSGFQGTATDWITIVPAGMPDNQYKEWHYTNGHSGGTMSFAGLPPGVYEVRGYFNWDGTQSYAVQARYKFTVGEIGPEVSLSTTKSRYVPSEAIVVKYAGFPGDASDWLTVVPAGTPDDQYRERHYTNGQTSGTMSFTGLVPGAYEVRGYFNWDKTQSYAVRARCKFTVGENTSLSTAKSKYAPSEKIVVNYAGFPGHVSDWLTVVPAGTPDNQYKERHFTDGRTGGTMSFAGLAPGAYEVRGYFNWDGTRSYAVQARCKFTVEQPYAAVNLTGRWRCNDGGIYYIRQIGNEVWWYGEANPYNPPWANVAKGKIEGNRVYLTWADIPKGGTAQSGSLQLNLNGNNRMVRISASGNFGGTEWTRQTTDNDNVFFEISL